MKRSVISAAVVGLILAVFLVSIGFSPVSEKSAVAKLEDNIVEQQVQQARGAYLAHIGNCMGCHTGQNGQPYAGGHILETPIGTFITPNITPDQQTGIGLWNEEDFWRALHEGKGRNGDLLYPAFPYTEYTRITREDSNAIFAYLQSLPSIQQQNPPNQIHFPFNFRPLIYIWRALYFEQGIYQPEAGKSDEWNRGAYLVQGLGHCNACHTTRNPLGASQGEILGGGQLMGSNWYAPSLTSLQEASTSDWPIHEIVQLLTVGLSSRAITTGPMAAVVSQSLQHLSKDDAHAMAVYLQSLPKTAPHSRGIAPELTEEVDRQLQHGHKIYETHCQDCHGSFGQGAPGAYPPLAGNRSVTLASPINVIRSILYGGYAPVTASNPRPYGMPPFAHILNDEEIALVLSYIRNAWGNRGSIITSVQVDRSRKGAQ
ncbi:MULTISPECIES: c-type cytochrome [Nitrosomonas]|uniref:Alcohol dehydrogenase n=1 Tax=Nitrosomonas communis TaxID=44574 RepID=A0A0F7KCE1_9PROT|nr:MULTISPECIES: cytochrome c [Nitrosomonas]AKH38195.1 alcohol dehydrogenase [Nitrosomonas communis]TYP91118.1 mono/diheme cytochrome c family protein [Nitrosomonas communis]UVS60161.1 cytochrome c [Nitrosomonas sp. PLL12]